MWEANERKTAGEKDGQEKENHCEIYGESEVCLYVIVRGKLLFLTLVSVLLALAKQPFLCE